MPVFTAANIDFMQLLAVLSLKMEFFAGIIYSVMIMIIVMVTIVF
ncbi:MAG: hypothetical protein BMS9Abin39_0636 [Ignavibacteria bacterium]|nr:MAG: hypothetical protein BMS9Abin39_0636 [Ignavibacteria bacterium]